MSHTLLGLILVIMSHSALASGFSHKVDLSARFDARHDKAPRYQYRVRWYPAFAFDSHWSLQGFVVTGDSFSSSHNTFGDRADHIALRRLYLRYQTANGKTEIGVIPTYKGKVSSTGLSKDGWITGIRQVMALGDGDQLEWVIGELDELDNPGIQGRIDSLNYLEVEYSAKVSDAFSYELGLERILDANYLRSEVRYQPDQVEYSLELVNRLANQRWKVVAGLTDQWRGIDYFAYYSYVNPEFGQRAELIEDFIDYGHSAALELEGDISSVPGLSWFNKWVLQEGTSRFQLGIKWGWK